MLSSCKLNIDGHRARRLIPLWWTWQLECGRTLLQGRSSPSLFRVSSISSSCHREGPQLEFGNDRNLGSLRQTSTFLLVGAPGTISCNREHRQREPPDLLIAAPI